MAEPTKPSLPGSLKEPAQKSPARSNTAPLSKPKYTLPIPLRTFPLPTFYPSNPISLLHLAVAWARQTLFPPCAEPSVVHQGVWSPETRSVHITDPKSMDDLWRQGFFGKGSLSRSEPNWLRRQLGETSEQRTNKRREERASTKWERGRSELETIEKKRREEASQATAEPPLEAQKQIQKQTLNGHVGSTRHIPTGCNDVALPTPDTGLCRSAVQADAIEATVTERANMPISFRPPVSPLDLLALPNSAADLRRILADHTQQSTQASEADVLYQFAPPVGPLELLALPNSDADLRAALSAAKAKINQEEPSTSLPTQCEAAVNGHVKESNGTANGSCAHPVPASKQENGSSVAKEPMKRRKSVRFAASVLSTTFQHSDPPSSNHAVLTQDAKRLVDSQQLVASERAISPSLPNGTAKSASTVIATAKKVDTPPSKPPMEDKEHLQLSAEEAFFLAYGLGVLVIRDPATQGLLSVQELFTLCRQYSYFPPRAPEALAPDDPFLVHYVVYHHFRALGWVPRHGIKFGVDWLLYGKGPALDHAEFGVMVMPSYGDPRWKTEGAKQAMRRSWHWLHSVNRVLSTVFKSMVLVYVDIPPPSVACDKSASALLQQYHIREVMVRRWSANRNRD